MFIFVVHLRARRISPARFYKAFGHRIPIHDFPLPNFPRKIEVIIVLVHPFRFQHFPNITLKLVSVGCQRVRLIRARGGQQHRGQLRALAHDILSFFAPVAFPLLDGLSVRPPDSTAVKFRFCPMISEIEIHQIAANPDSIPLRLAPKECPCGP